MANLFSRGISSARRRSLAGAAAVARCFSGVQICRDLFYHVAQAFTPAIMTPARQGTRFLVSTADRVVGREVFLTGDFDRAEAEKAFAVIEKAGFGDFAGKTFVDIGANIGTATIGALSRFGFERAVSFEPDPNNFRIFSANVVLNGLQDRVTIHHSAMSDFEGTIDFETCDDNSGDGRVRTAGAAGTADMLRESERKVIKVQATTVDRAFSSGLLDMSRIGMVWIDTQGHEGHVLRGGKESLLRSNLPIVLEYWPYTLRRAGGLELFESLIGEHFSSIIDVRRSTKDAPWKLPASEIKTLRDHYAGPFDMTDLLLLK